MSAQANPNHPAPAPGHPPTAGPQPVPIHPSAAALAHVAPPKDKRVLRRVLMLGCILVVLGATTVAYLCGGRYVGTDDAYVKSAQLNVTTDVSGMVKSVEVREGQRVKA